MISDTTQDSQILRSIIKSVKDMDLSLLHRIAYVYRCEQLDIRPDSWKLYPEEN
jgi:hypothetical protein